MIIIHPNTLPVKIIQLITVNVYLRYEELGRDPFASAVSGTVHA